MNELTLFQIIRLLVSNGAIPEQFRTRHLLNRDELDHLQESYIRCALANSAHGRGHSEHYIDRTQRVSRGLYTLAV